MKSQMKSGFTLVELLMVIAIVGIISMLAIQKLTGLKEDAKEKINVANLTRIAQGVEAYISAHSDDYSASINRLDSLMVRDKTGTEGTIDISDKANLMCYTGIVSNVGITKMLNTPNSKAKDKNLLLGTYYLSLADVNVLKRDLGLTEVMTGLDENNVISSYGKDDELHAWVSQSAINDPDTCAGYGMLVTNGLPVAIVNPCMSTSDRIPLGPAIYSACGHPSIHYSVTASVYINGVAYDDGTTAAKALATDDGLLLAFGLGQNCTLIGNNEGGFDTAPICPIMLTTEYRRYVILFKAKFTAKNDSSGSTTYTMSKIAYAGIMDPSGKMLDLAR